jgi:hypothetical protein
MDWIKRNLYFVIGSAVALVLMGLAGYYLYSKWQLNNEILEKLNADYAELDRLNKENPHPGSPPVDNSAEAKKQQQQVRDEMKNCSKYFEKVPAIPDSGKVTGQEFSASLRRTIDQLQRTATNASIGLPADYNFSFQAEKPRVNFAAGSLDPLSVQLGEIKAICDVLYQAKINALDNIRRERVSPDDASGPQTDYLEIKSVTNELAVVTPYELTFRCFSSELASVLAGFAASPYALLVRTLNVEPAAGSTSTSPTDTPAEAPMPVFSPFPGGPQTIGERQAFMRRYGINPSSRRGAEGPAAYMPQAQAAPPPVATAVRPGGLQPVLDEKLLRVTLNLRVIKLLPSK